MKNYYLGCIDGKGHYLFPNRADKNGLYWPKNKCIPWGYEADTGLCTKNGNQRQGHALIHHKDNWTAMAWWDRTIDERPGSNSVLFVEGTHNFHEMVGLLQTFWLEVFKRQPAGLFLDYKP